MKERVGFIGLGAMGKAMAGNLAKFLSSDAKPDNAEPLLYVFNRDAKKSEAFASQPENACVRCLVSLNEVADLCDVIIMMLSDDKAVTETVGHIIASQVSLDGSVIVNCSTILPETSNLVAEQLQQVGASYLAAPVFGRPDAAAAALLLAYTSGPLHAHMRALPYISCTSRKVTHVGEEHGKANALKLSGNFMIAGMIELLSEAMTLTEKNGVSREHFTAFVNDFFPAPPIVGYGGRIARDEFEAGQGFTVDLALKDVGHMRRIAALSQSPLPIADLVYNNLLSAQAHGWGQKDWGAIALSVRNAAGLKTPAGDAASHSSSS